MLTTVVDEIVNLKKMFSIGFIYCQYCNQALSNMQENNSPKLMSMK